MQARPQSCGNLENPEISQVQSWDFRGQKTVGIPKSQDSGPRDRILCVLKIRNSDRKKGLTSPSSS